MAYSLVDVFSETTRIRQFIFFLPGFFPDVTHLDTYREDDTVQYYDIDFEGGANEQSLRQARENYKQFGASSLRHIKKVRPPAEDEI